MSKPAGFCSPRVSSSRFASRLRSAQRDDHSSRSRIAPGLQQPTRGSQQFAPSSSLHTGWASPPLLFGLAPRGVFHAPDVAIRAVGSYPTFSPLPNALDRNRQPCGFPQVCRRDTSLTGGLIFCGTFRRRRFTAGFHRRTSHEGHPPGVTRRVALSSPALASSRRSVEAVFSCSPQPSFFDRLRFSAPEFACHFHLLEANVSKRPFARPQRLFPFENHRGEVNAPDLSLRRNSKLFFQPVRSPAPILCHALHAAGDDRCLKPVAVSQAQNPQTSIQLPLPFGTFIPAGSQRSAGGSI
jgi:hypothetical protein